MAFKQFILATLASVSLICAHAQKITGTLRGLPVQKIFLYETIGSDHPALDSTIVHKGRFQFSKRKFSAGFYQIGVNDTDRVDIILDPREPEVLIQFSGSPLQENILIGRSDENQRLWEYKQISRRSQERAMVLSKQRETVDLADKEAVAKFDSIQRSILEARYQALDRLMDQSPDSYFSYLVSADRKVTKALDDGPLAMASSMSWTDDRLLRSTVFPKALMGWLQHASSELPEGHISAIDSVMHWTKAHPPAWVYSRSFMIRLFEQFGPDHMAQYLVDEYVHGSGALLPADEDLADLLAERSKLSVGAVAPDVPLHDPLNGSTFQLHELVKANALTCLFFYSSTCDHCHEQIPGLLRSRQQYHDNGFEVIGIALDPDLQEFRSMLVNKEIPWSSYSDLNGWGSAAAKAFQVKATPTLFLLDQKAMIVAKPYDQQELEQELRKRIP